jgi:hypothetical protein
LAGTYGSGIRAGLVLVAVSGNQSRAARPEPSAGEDKTFIAAVQDARADIANGIDQGGLRHDPLRYPLTALSNIVGLFPAFLDEIQRARAPWTEDERRAAIAHAVTRMDARLVQRMAQFNRWAIVAAALLGMAIVLGACSGGYWWGYRAAENRLAPVPAALGAALTGREAEVWLNLIQNNDIGRVGRTCAPQHGREACAFTLWTEPVPPPRAKETR